MSLTIDLAPIEEQHLAEQAAHAGVPVSDYARRLIRGSLESAAREAKAQRAVSTLRGWIAEARSAAPDEQAQSETQEWEDAARAVDEDRLSSRSRFPDLAPDATSGSAP